MVDGLNFMVDLRGVDGFDKKMIILVYNIPLHMLVWIEGFFLLSLFLQTLI